MQAPVLQALRLVCVRTLRRLAVSGGSDRGLSCSITARLLTSWRLLLSRRQPANLESPDIANEHG